MFCCCCCWWYICCSKHVRTAKTCHISTQPTINSTCSSVHGKFFAGRGRGGRVPLNTNELTNQRNACVLWCVCVCVFIIIKRVRVLSTESTVSATAIVDRKTRAVRSTASVVRAVSATQTGAAPPAKYVSRPPLIIGLFTSAKDVMFSVVFVCLFVVVAADDDVSMYTNFIRSTSKSQPNNIRGEKCPSVRPSDE